MQYGKASNHCHKNLMPKWRHVDKRCNIWGTTFQACHVIGTRSTERLPNRLVGTCWWAWYQNTIATNSSCWFWNFERHAAAFFNHGPPFPRYVVPWSGYSDMWYYGLDIQTCGTMVWISRHVVPWSGYTDHGTTYSWAIVPTTGLFILYCLSTKYVKLSWQSTKYVNSQHDQAGSHNVQVSIAIILEQNIINNVFIIVGYTGCTSEVNAC